MSLSRQRERAMFRRLNDSAKMRTVLENLENAEQQEKLNKFEEKRNGRLQDMAFSLLVFSCGIVMISIVTYVFTK